MLKKLVIFFALLLILLASSWALFKPGIFKLHDFVHGARIAEMATALKDGHFPVRWSQHFGYGYGMPLFEFYAPLPYFVGALFYLIGVPLVSSVKLLFLICTIFTVAGGYKLGSQLYGRAGGIVTAAAITLAPYRAVNLFVRGAVSESWAIMAMVWALYFTLQTIKKKKNSWFGLVISLSVLFLSHNLMTLLFVPFGAAITIAYAFLQGDKIYKPLFSISNLLQAIKSSAVVFSGYVVAVGCAAFYLLPAFFEKEFTKVEQYITGGYFDYHLHFVYLRQFVTPYWGYGGSEWGPNDGISFFLGIGQLIGLLLFSVTVIRFLLAKKKRIVSGRKISFLVVVGILLVIGLLFATEKSVAVWNSIELLKFIQFPWRTLSIVLICVGLLTSALLLTIPSFIKRWTVAWVLLLVLLANAWLFRPEVWLESANALYYSSPERISKDMSGILPDYIPSALQEGLPVPQQLVICDKCETEVLVERTHQKLVAVKAATDTTIVFSVAYFPGWVAEVNGEPADLVVNDQGLITVTVPAGSSKVGILLQGTPLRQWSDLISAVSVILVLGIYLYSAKKEKLHGNH
jgi:hypothetical protein